MRCRACTGELILTTVVSDDTVAVRGVEHHTFICSGCHVAERRVVFIKDGREADGPPMPEQAARRIRRAPTVPDEHIAAPGRLASAPTLRPNGRPRKSAFSSNNRRRGWLIASAVMCRRSATVDTQSDLLSRRPPVKMSSV